MYVSLYHPYSKGGKALSLALGATRTHLQKLTKIPIEELQKAGVLINWGCTKLPALEPKGIKIINKAAKVAVCSNKRKFFSIVEGQARTPEYTDELSEAMAWIKDGHQVLGRRFKGHSGEDIAFFEEDPDEFNDSDFYVKYKKKKAEYRVHVMGNEVLFIQKKVLRVTLPDGSPVDKSKVDFRIRNLANGFLFQKHDFTTPTDVIEQAKKAVLAVGLDFGAVDVIYNELEDQAYVLETNTAPGLEGTSPGDYATGLKKLIANA